MRFNFLTPLILLLFGGWTDFGVNFRATNTFVTDGANETYCIRDDYPVTRGGGTFGWLDSASTGAGARDRDNAVDRRLAGQNSNGVLDQERWELDLAPGTYNIHLAIGDVGSDQVAEHQYVQILDNTTVLATIDDANGTLTAEFDDATGVNRTLANWAANEVVLTKTFASTKMILKVGANTAGAKSTIAHVRLVLVASSDNSSVILRALGIQ